MDVQKIYKIIIILAMLGIFQRRTENGNMGNIGL